MKPLVTLSAVALTGCAHPLLDGRLANLIVGALFALYAVALAKPRRVP